MHKTYELELMCGNCEKSFTIAVECGKEVNYSRMPGNDGMWIEDISDAITCPKCLTWRKVRRIQR